jgi:Mg-chelatase subunit ChlI
MRPQLLDRFGLSVDVRTVMDMDERLALTLSRSAYDRDPEAFVAASAPESDGVLEQIAAARERLKGVTMAKDLRLKVAELCSVLDVEGLRGDIVTTRAALALAAWEDRAEAVEDDVMRVAGMALGHRMRKDPLDPIDGGAKVSVALKRVIKGEKPQRKAPKEEEAGAAAAPEEDGARAKLKPGQWRGL